MSNAIRHWWTQRVSSVLMIPLALWLLWAGASLTGADYNTAAAFMGSPFNGMMAVFTAIVALYHAQSGITVIVEDYVPGKRFPATLILVTRVGCGLGVAAVFAAAFMLSFGA